MTAFKNAFIVSIAWVLLAACTTSGPTTSSASEALVVGGGGGSAGVWTFEGGGYAFTCLEVYPCGSCACLPDRCPSNVSGQACDNIGEECNLPSGSTYKTLECEPAGGGSGGGSGGGGGGFVWTRTSTESCADICGTTSCSCVTNRCSGNPEGQSCPTYSNSCNVVSGPNYIELTCL